MPSKKSENAVTSPRSASSVKKPAGTRLHKKASSAAPAIDNAISTDEIAQLAYSYWESRGYQGGSPEEDWLRAEAELRQRVMAATA